MKLLAITLGLCGVVVVLAAALVSGAQSVRLPWAVFVPMGLWIAALGTLCISLWLAWNHAGPEEKWSPRYAWVASWAVVATIAATFLVVTGAWLAAAPL